MHRRTSLAAVLALLAGPAMAAPQVVADILPTGALVQEVLGDTGTVRVLLPRDAGAHHYQMKPSDAQALQSADLLIWMGPAMTPWLDRAAGNLGDAAQLRLLEVEGVALRPLAEPGHPEHAHDHAEGESHADHDHGAVDPHAWLDADNAGPWLDTIAATLAELDPPNAATYRSNAAAAARRIALLDDSLRDRLAPHAGARFVVFHDAYGYFTDHFGLQPAVAVALGDASAPSAARLDQIRDTISHAGATCAFPEYGQDAALLEAVIEGSEVKLGAPLSPEGSQLEPGAGQYEALLTTMADTMIACFADK